MSWKAYEQPQSMSSAEKVKVPVTVSLSAQGSRGTGRLRLKVVVRTEHLEGGLPWWKTGTMCSLLIGEGENAGAIRIEPGKTLILRQAGGTGGRPMLSVAAWPGLSDEAVKAQPVTFDYSEKWIEIELPHSVMARASRGQPVQSAVSSAPAGNAKGAPFRGLGSTGPHPHPQMQRPARG
jgi:hypothetical protein